MTPFFLTLVWQLLINPVLSHPCSCSFFLDLVLLKHSTALSGLGINSMATMLQLNNVAFYLPSSHFDHFLNNDRFSWQHLPLLSGRTGKTLRSRKRATNIMYLLFCFWRNWHHQLHFIWLTGSDDQFVVGTFIIFFPNRISGKYLHF